MDGRSFEKLKQLLLLLILLGVGVDIRIHVNSIKEEEFSKADEQIYLMYTEGVRDHGILHYDRLVDFYMARQELWLFPPPLRYGYYFLARLFCGTAGGYSKHALANLATAASVVSLGLCYLLGWRVGGGWCGIVALALYLFSPLALALGRRALADMPYVVFALSGIWFFHEALVYPSRRLLGCVALFLLLMQVAVKEVGFFALVLLALWLGFRCVQARRWHGIGWMALVGAGAGYYLLFSLLAHDFRDFFKIGRAMTSGLGTNEYVTQYQNGPWHRYLIDWISLSPLVLLLLPAAVYAVNVSPSCPPSHRFLSWVLVGYFLIITFSGISFNVRYMLLLEIPARVLVALFLLSFVRGEGVGAGWRAGWRTAGVSALLMINAVVEWGIFRQVFLVEKVYDPVSYTLLKALRFIP
jgi:4-amino-4-deoxy-L-arabinose transferase-like glycosyltransferase